LRTTTRPVLRQSSRASATGDSAPTESTREEVGVKLGDYQFEYLDEASDRSLKRLAARTGRSETSHIREALRRYLGSGTAPDNDPLERLIGLVEDADGPDDVAENHDHYLYGAPTERS
jgi:hypothetical protein